MHDTSELDNQENHQRRHCTLQVRAVLSNKSHQLADKINSWTLFAKITVWVLLALITFILLSLGLSGKGWGVKLIEYLGTGAKPYQKTTIALTLVGGIGAVGYLVIKYQERTAAQRSEQRTIQKRETEDLLTAIHLLGDDKPSTRIAGVQSLTEIGQNHPEMRQRVIDILCGYLRTDRGEKDGPVESTILKTMQKHFTEPHKYLGIKTKYRSSQLRQLNDIQMLVPDEEDLYWNGIDIDLHDSIFTEEVDFGYTRCRSLDMRNTKFKSPEGASFRHATFERQSYFCGMQSSGSGQIDFTGSYFKGPADFSRTNLYQINFEDSFIDYSFFYEAIIRDTNFTNAVLNHALFINTKIENTTFTGTSLNYAEFQDAELTDVSFSDTTLLNPHFYFSTLINSTFNTAKLIDTNFDYTKLYGIHFESSIIQNTHFYNSTFENAEFCECDLDNIDFRGTQFVGQVTFRKAKFTEKADFKDTIKGAYIRDEKNKDQILFDQSRFFCNPDFGQIPYDGALLFRQTRFLKTAPRDLLSNIKSDTGAGKEIIFSLDPIEPKQSSNITKEKSQTKNKASTATGK